jgi:hypothetical protein
VPQELADWWTAFQQANPQEPVQATNRPRPRKRRRNRSRRKPEVKT